jgi:iodotyrosine deiodinase
VVSIGVSDVILLVLAVMVVYSMARSLWRGSRRTGASSAAMSIYPADLTMEQFGAPKEGHVAFRYQGLEPAVMLERARAFAALHNLRRSVRFFDASRPIPAGVLEECIRAAGTSPSGAHQQPWTFVIVRSAERKRAIRAVVEREEQKNYDRRMRKEWVQDVAPLVSALHRTDGSSAVSKPYLTDAPALVVVMKHYLLPLPPRAAAASSNGSSGAFSAATSSPTPTTKHQAADSDGDVDAGADGHPSADGGGSRTVYYAEHGVGIATGILLTALTNVGLVTLTSTPMGAEADIRRICERPDNEKVFLLLPVGFPAEDATVPYRDAHTLRKPLEDIMVEI